MEIGKLNVHVENNTIENSTVTVLHEENAAPGALDKDTEILSDLERVQERLDETQATLAYLLSQLEEAVKKKDKSNVDKLRDLVVKSGSTVLAGIASKALLAWLGIK